MTASLLALLIATASAEDETMQRGKDVYTARCATCHGSEGRGDGPAAGALPRAPRDFSATEFWAGTTEERIRATITGGRPGTAMRAFPMKEDQLSALVAYLQTFKPAAPTD